MEEKQLKEAIAAVMKDRTQRDALAQMLVEYIDPQHVTVDIMGLLMPSRALKPGDSLVRKVRKGIKVWSHTPGAIGLKSEVTVTDRVTYMLDTAIVGVTA